jgi:predicted nucleic acid-binding Zn ribbon protein
MPAECVRCGKPVERGRRKYCSDACADSAARARIKVRKAAVTPRLLYRYYPKAPE